MNNNNNNNIMLIDAADSSEVRVVVLQNGDIDHFDFISKSKQQIKGNIYLGKITRIEPSLQAAFVEYGGDKQGFLSFSEIHHDYYQIPVEDRKKLQEEMERMAERMAERDNYDDDDSADDSIETTQPQPQSRNKSRTPREPREPREPRTDKSEDKSEEAREEVKAKGSKVRRRGGRRKILGNRNFEDATNEAQNEAISAGQNPSPEAALPPEVGFPNDNAKDSKPLAPPLAMAVEDSDDNLIASQEIDILEIDMPEIKASDLGLESTETTEIIAEINVEQDVAKDVETIAETGDEVEELRNNNFAPHRRYKIQEVLKPGQLVLVQVIKEERGNKGVSVSTYISLAGRYCVVMPNSPKGGGISRKIGSGEDRKRLREISDELKEISGMSAIIRTAGLDRSKAEIKRDYEYLINLWNKVREDALASIAPALVYEENDIIKRSIRDHYDGHLEGGVLVQGDAAYRKAKEFMKLLMPSHAPKIKQYKATAPLLAEYGVEGMLAELYRPIVPLKSGGYLVINPTEALISVDVNSGRSTNEKNVEETAYRTNLEACEELARQLRLRNLGGLIVVDFIDMSYHKYRRNVERALKDALKDDRAKIQIGAISTFGLLELSRQRIGSSLEESTTHSCPACSGSGRVPMPEAIALQLLRNLQYFLSEYEEGGAVSISLSQPLMLELLNNHRTMLDKLTADFKVTFVFELHPENRDMVYGFKGKGNARFDSVNSNERKGKFAPKNKRSKNRPEKREIIEEVVPDIIPEEVVEVIVDAAATIEGEEVVKKSRRRGKRGGKNQQRRKQEAQEGQDNQDAEPDAITETPELISELEPVAELEQIDEPQIIEPQVEPQVVKPKPTRSRQPARKKTEPKLEIMPENKPEQIIEIAPIQLALTQEEQETILEKNNEPKRKGWWQRVLDA